MNDRVSCHGRWNTARLAVRMTVGHAACAGLHVQVRKTVQQQLAQALFKLSVEFRKEETRFLNRMEAQKGLEAGSSLGLVADDGGAGAQEGSYAVVDPGFTQAQMMRVHQAEGLAQERDEEIRKVN
jgi:syntaxin 16